MHEKRTFTIGSIESTKLYLHPTTIPLHDVPEGKCVWLCTHCQFIVGKGKVPFMHILTT